MDSIDAIIWFEFFGEGFRSGVVCSEYQALETTDSKDGVVTLTAAVIGAQEDLLPHDSLVTRRPLVYQPDRQERYGGAAEEYLSK